MPRLALVSPVMLVLLATMPGCSSASSSASSASLVGTWRLCDLRVETNPSSAYYIPYGGQRIELDPGEGLLSATDGRIDGGTALLMSGPFDGPSRTWTADYYLPHEDGMGDELPSYPAAVSLVFSADGTRFRGQVNLPDEVGTWYGGQENGVFSCEAAIP